MAKKMAEELPPTGLTLAGAKKYLSDNFVKHTLKKVSELYFGLDVWDVKAMEEVPNVNSLRRRNFRLYTQGLEDDSKAWWESTQGPMSAPTPPAPESTFLEQVRSFLIKEAQTNEIKAAELLFGDNEMERATAVIIDSASKEKRVVISKDTDDAFLMEDYTPLSATEIAPTK